MLQELTALASWMTGITAIAFVEIIAHACVCGVCLGRKVTGQTTKCTAIIRNGVTGGAISPLCVVSAREYREKLGVMRRKLSLQTSRMARIASITRVVISGHATVIAVSFRVLMA